MTRHRFTKNQILQHMHCIDPSPNVPVGIVFLMALGQLFTNAKIQAKFTTGYRDIKLAEPSRWWRDKATGDLIVEQG